MKISERWTIRARIAIPRSSVHMTKTYLVTCHIPMLAFGIALEGGLLGCKKSTPSASSVGAVASGPPASTAGTGAGPAGNKCRGHKCRGHGRRGYGRRGCGRRGYRCRSRRGCDERKRCWHCCRRRRRRCEWKCYAGRRWRSVRSGRFGQRFWLWRCKRYRIRHKRQWSSLAQAAVQVQAAVPQAAQARVAVPTRASRVA